MFPRNPQQKKSMLIGVVIGALVGLIIGAFLPDEYNPVKMIQEKFFKKEG